MYLNRTTLCGRLAADPEYRKGKKEDGSDDRTWFRVAANRPGTEEADFVPAVCWGKLARAVAQYCSKGKEVILDGALRTRPQKREDGSYDNYFEIVCQHVSFGADAKNKDTAPAVASVAGNAAINDQMITAIAQALLAQQGGGKASSANESDDCPFV